MSTIPFDEIPAAMADAAIRWAADRRARVELAAEAAAVTSIAPRLHLARRRLSDAWASPKMLGCMPDWQAERASYMLAAQGGNAAVPYEVRG